MRGDRQISRGLAPFVLVLFAGCLAGCTREPESAVPQAREQLVVGQVGRVDNVNELLAEPTDLNRDLSRLLFLPLLEELPDFAAGPPTYRPLLAESWERSEDGKVLTFRLRPGLSWSDGAPLTAHDVRFTWLAQVSPEIQWPLAPSDNLLDVEVVDPLTVRFHFEREASTQLADAIAGGVLPRHLWSLLPFAQWRSSPHWFAEHLASSGPYTVSEWAAPERVELRANPHYQVTEPPRLERVVLRFLASDAALLTMLRAGEVGFAFPVRASELRQLEGERDIETLDYPLRQVTFVSWNLERALFSDARVRRALGLAIDRRAIVDTLWFGAAKVGSSPIPASVWAHDQELVPLPYDPPAARRELASAGWVDRDRDGVLDREGVPFRFELLTNTSNEQRWDALQMIRADLADIGVDAVPRRLELAAVGAALMRGAYDAAVTAFGIETNLDLRFWFHSSNAESHAFNYGGYRSEAADRLLDVVAAAEDPRSVLPELHELQRLVERDQPVLFLWEPSGLVAFANGLENVRPNALGVLWNLEEWDWR